MKNYENLNKLRSFYLSCVIVLLHEKNIKEYINNNIKI